MAGNADAKVTKIWNNSVIYSDINQSRLLAREFPGDGKTMEI